MGAPFRIKITETDPAILLVIQDRLSPKILTDLSKSLP